VNLMVGCGMQQARGARGGVDRQGGEEPRRRPVMLAWQRVSEAHLGAWERIPLVMSMERRIFGQPYGRRSTAVEPSEARRVSESEALEPRAGQRHLGDCGAARIMASPDAPTRRGTQGQVVRRRPTSRTETCRSGSSKSFLNHRDGASDNAAGGLHDAASAVLVLITSSREPSAG
jgi:hypothetical protein